MHPRTRGVTNAWLTETMDVQRVERDRLGLVHLKWCDEPEEQVKEALRERKNEMARRRRHEAARAEGKPTARERSEGSIAQLARITGVSRQTIYNWLDLGTLSVKISRRTSKLTLDAPYKDISASLSVKIEIEWEERLRRADAPPRGLPSLAYPPQVDNGAGIGADPRLPPVEARPLAMLPRSDK